MELFLEIIKFLIYSCMIVLISKYILVTTIRKLAQSLNLSSKTVGDVAGYATSVPELLTIGASSFNGLIGTSIYNILSSNVINLIQYLGIIVMNKNQSAFKNMAIKVDIVLVLATILIPIILLIFNIEINIALVPLFIILYVFFRYINNNAHKLYLSKEDKKIEESEGNKNNKESTFTTIKYTIYLLISGILLFGIGNLLGDTLEILCNTFNVSEFIMGILLGFITSLPELITFMEAQKHHSKLDNNMLGVVEATNNLFTSNILNLFAIQSIGVIIYVIFA